MVFRQVFCMSNFKDNSGLEKWKPKMSEEERKELMKKFLDQITTRCFCWDDFDQICLRKPIMLSHFQGFTKSNTDY